jgi:hypothetical protein
LEGVCFPKARWPNAVGELHLESGGTMMKLRDRAIELRF